MKVIAINRDISIDYRVRSFRTLTGDYDVVRSRGYSLSEENYNAIRSELNKVGLWAEKSYGYTLVIRRNRQEQWYLTFDYKGILPAYKKYGTVFIDNNGVSYHPSYEGFGYRIDDPYIKAAFINIISLVRITVESE